MLLCLPLFALLIKAFWGIEQTADLHHIIKTNLGTYTANSVILTFFVCAGVFVVGVGLAWFFTMYRFPGSRFLTWASVLPLAFPSYIVAYAYTGMFDYGGGGDFFIKEILEQKTGIQMRSMGGAIFVFTFVLYPYVYLITRASLLMQSGNFLTEARALGIKNPVILYKLIVPLARPAIVAGIALTAMETLSDYATVRFFGVTTLSVGIWRTWFGLGLLDLAALLSMVMLVFMVCAVFTEEQARNKARYYNETEFPISHLRRTLTGKAAWSATFLSSIPVLLGFVVPMIQLAVWSKIWAGTYVLDNYTHTLGNTLFLGTVAAIFTTLAALVVVCAHRTNQLKGAGVLYTVCIHSYVLPGIVAAVGIVIAITSIEKLLDFGIQSIASISLPFFFSGTVLTVLFAYSLHFFAISHHAIHNGFLKMPPSFEHSIQLLQSSWKKRWTWIYLPYLRPALLTSLLLVFIDSIKELPMVFVLRPFDFETLSITAYEMSETEQLSKIGIPALTIVAISLIPVSLLSYHWSLDNKRQRSNHMG